MKEKIPLIFGVPPLSFYEERRFKKVFVAELRPGLEGMRLTAKDCLERGIRPVVICDNMLAFCMWRGLIKEVHVFSREMKGGEALCRTGTLIAVLAAKAHKIPAYLYMGRKKRPKISPLAMIGARRVIVSGIKTYAPLFEKVPLALVKNRSFERGCR